MKKSLFYSLVLCLIPYLFYFCSDSVTEPNKDNGTQFPAQGIYEGLYWPTADWRRCAPEEVGLDSKKLMQAYEYAKQPALESSAILIIRNGYIVGEAYMNGADINSILEGYSFVKSFTSAVTGIAIDQGYIRSVENYVYEYLPHWTLPGTDPKKKRIKIKHLLSMTSGLEWQSDSLVVADYEMIAFGDYLAYVLLKDAIHEPGTHWEYTNGQAILMSGVLETALNMTVEAFSYQVLQDKIGIPHLSWSSDMVGHTNTAWGMRARVRDYAKLGYLYLRKGQWDEQKIISESWIEESTRAVSDSVNFYAYYWWLPSAFSTYSEYEIPAYTFLAVGAQGQYMIIVPDKDMVVLRMGQGLGNEETPWDTMKFLSLILNAIQN